MSTRESQSTRAESANRSAKTVSSSGRPSSVKDTASQQATPSQQSNHATAGHPSQAAKRKDSTNKKFIKEVLTSDSKDGYAVLVKGHGKHEEYEEVISEPNNSNRREQRKVVHQLVSGSGKEGMELLFGNHAAPHQEEDPPTLKRRTSAPFVSKVMTQGVKEGVDALFGTEASPKKH
ncbi:hypothetical protein HDU78_002741 [Chytriomyces hyalinus]|nr:hypothetical protein HDU78_002741 [Chytriomyces hyalinus]